MLIIFPGLAINLHFCIFCKFNDSHSTLLRNISTPKNILQITKRNIAAKLNI